MNCKRYILCVLALLLCCQASRSENAAERTLRDFRRMGVPVYEADEVKLLPTATEKFHDLFQTIDQAEHYILLDYFKFQEDSICGELVKRLAAKVRQGVEVRILFDSFGNKNSDQPLSRARLDSIRGAGIGIEGFDPVRFPWVNHLLHRNHHKIAVIDGQLVYTGGMNVADYYLYGKPSVGRWRDMHIRMSGSIVQAYEELFWKMWGKEQGARGKGQGARGKGQEARSKEQGAREYQHPKQSSCPLPLAPCPQNPVPCPSVSVAFASRWPRQTPRIMRQTYCTAIDNADQLIQIVNPYAMLFGQVRAALRRALQRGVRVQFMVSTKSDGKVNDDVTGLEMHKLMKRGAEVYYYDGGFHHSKVMMIDSLFCTVGTTNLDARSLCFDYEVNAFIFSRTTTEELMRIFSDDVRHSTLLTPEVWQQRFPPRRRLRGRFFTIAKRLM